jgi:hypothetical protein
VGAALWPPAPEGPAWAQRAAVLDAWRLARAGRPRRPEGPVVVDVGRPAPQETTQTFVDAQGRRYVVVTRLVR